MAVLLSSETRPRLRCASTARLVEPSSHDLSGSAEPISHSFTLPCAAICSSDQLVNPLVYGAYDDTGGDPETAPHSSTLGSRDPPPSYSFPLSIDVADIRTEQTIELDAYQAGTLVALSIADFSEQWHGWQDEMFATTSDGGRLRYTCPKRSSRVLWPGDVRPGLFLHTLSHMGRLVLAANAALEADGDPRRIPVRALRA